MNKSGNDQPIHASAQLLDLVGELGLAAADVTQHPELEGFEIAVHRLENLIRELQSLASSLCLVPVGTVFKRMQRLVHDPSHQTGKPIDLVLQGGDTKIDKSLAPTMVEGWIARRSWRKPERPDWLAPMKRRTTARWFRAPSTSSSWMSRCPGWAGRLFSRNICP